MPDKVSPFSSPPTSGSASAEGSPPSLPQRPRPPREPVATAKTLQVGFDPPPLNPSIASKRRDREQEMMDGSARGQLTPDVTGEARPTLPSRPLSVTMEKSGPLLRKYHLLDLRVQQYRLPVKHWSRQQTKSAQSRRLWGRPNLGRCRAGQTRYLTEAPNGHPLNPGDQQQQLLLLQNRALLIRRLSCSPNLPTQLQPLMGRIQMLQTSTGDLLT